jgi:Bacterial capsule synthesis protein PGA_cap
VLEIVRGADAIFTNLEMLFHDYESYAMNESGGTYMRAEPALAKELVWAGFDLVSRANNHTADYGVLGMNLTTSPSPRRASCRPVWARAWPRRVKRDSSKHQKRASR